MMHAIQKRVPKSAIQEEALRRTLSVNPGLRSGRTTQEIRLELLSNKPIALMPSKPQGQDASAFKAWVTRKQEAVNARLTDIEARQKALAVEAEAIRAKARTQLYERLDRMEALDRAEAVKGLKKHFAGFFSLLEHVAR